MDEVDPGRGGKRRLIKEGSAAHSTGVPSGAVEGGPGLRGPATL